MVTKLDARGSEAWTSYYSGSGHSYATGITLDSTGRPWGTGWTCDSGFPLVNPTDTQYNVCEIFFMQYDPADGSVLDFTQSIDFRLGESRQRHRDGRRGRRILHVYGGRTRQRLREEASDQSLCCS